MSCFGRCGCSRGLGRNGSGTGLWMRVWISGKSWRSAGTPYRMWESGPATIAARLARVAMMKTDSQDPFELPQNGKTVAKYSQVWERFICYVMRTAPAQWEDETETGVTFTQEQWQCIQRIRQLLEQDNMPTSRTRADDKLVNSG